MSPAAGRNAGAADRKRGARRALDYIIACAGDARALAPIGHELLFCLYNTMVTSADSGLASDARVAGTGLAWRWHSHARRVFDTCVAGDVDALLATANGLFAASRFGCVDAELVAETARALNSLPLRRLLGFDPARTRPLNGVAVCSCGRLNHRRAAACASCGRMLRLEDAFAIWMHALVVTHAGEGLHISLGAPYARVVAWRGAMLPYVDADSRDDERVFDCFYAVTHLLYTLTDYGVYLLPDGALRTEQTYLKRMLARAMRSDDQEMVSEASECLRLFRSHAMAARLPQTTRYLLERQDDDGSWGGGRDWYHRLHRAWVGFDALRDWTHPGGKRSRRWIASRLRSNGRALEDKGASNAKRDGGKQRTV